ncbi:MAG: tetratricopeptide repeat protein, partial [Bacteroidota bacterium]
MKKLPLYLFGMLFCTISQGIAQGEVTTRDKVEITYRAEQMVQELNDLLNVLTFSDVFDSEIKTLIENSTAESNNQLFFNANVIIEDDIDPRNIDHNRAKDREVVDYLQELNLSYQKSDDYTIQFMEFEVSQVYEKNYPYVLVKFRSKFSSTHKSIDQAYQTTTRIAEIRAVKEDEAWNTYISRIAFFNPSSEFTVADYETEGMPPMLASVDTTGLDEAQKRILLEQDRQRREQQAALAEIRAEVQRLAEKEKREEQQRGEVSERLIQEGDEAFAVGDFETALQAYDESKRVNPYQTVAFQKINAVNKALADEAAKLRQAELRYQDLTTKGKYAYRIREFETAITLLKEALELRPRSGDIDETIREIEKIQLDARRYGEKERTNDFAGAIKDYSRAIKEQPDNAVLYVSRARCYELTQKPKKAFDDYSKAIELYDEYHLAHQKRGDINFANQEYALAENDYSRAISLKKEDPPLLIKRSKVRQLLGDMPKAIEDYSSAIRQRPTNGKFYLDRGHLYLRTQQKEKAFEDFTSSLTLSPELYDAWFQRGWLSIEKDNVEDAASDFTRAKKEGLSDQEWQRVVSQGQVYYQSGLNALNQGNHEGAIGHLTNAVTVDSDFAAAWYARAQAQEKQQAYREAVSDYSAAIKRDPNYADAFFRRGSVKASRGEFEAAALDFGEATRIQPNMIQAHVAQAEAYTELERLTDAISAY